MKKKLFVLAMGICMAFSTLTCAAAETDIPKILVVFPTLDDPFYKEMIAAGDEAAEDYGVTVDWMSYDSQLDKEIALIENAVVQGYDAVIADPLDTTALVSAVDKATDAGVKVITCGGIVEGKENTSSVYADRAAFGALTEALILLAGEKGTIGFIQSVKGNWTMEQREAGVMDAVAKYPDIEVDVQLTNNDVAKAQTITESWISNVPDLIGIVGVNSPYTITSIAAAESLGKADSLLWAAHGGIEDTIPYLESGQAVYDNMIGGYRCGYWNVAAAARMIAGEDVPQIITMKLIPLMSEETAAALKEKGFVAEGWITPEEAAVRGKQYKEEFGPEVPLENIVGDPINF